MSEKAHETHEIAGANEPTFRRFPEPLPRIPLVWGPATYDSLSQEISEITEKAQPGWWWPAFLITASLLHGAILAATYLISTGVGIWGSNNPVNWAFDITNFVFWIGIGHAATLISAILFLFRQYWRTSVNRSAEAMSMFAVMCALLFPGIHVGRPWVVYWMAPVPNQMSLWPGFRSP